MQDPCDYNEGGCHHLVHAFGEPGPLCYLIDAGGAQLAVRAVELIHHRRYTAMQVHQPAGPASVR
ncbi:hypothetical protein DEJ30_08455 [Curtobacterium sp. MCPF17_003]|nr:hypothetical protein DEJ30_08455 [Curtobacterium sp. MCPF17_003]